MQQEQSIGQLKYLFCEKGDLHQGEPLDLVCLIPNSGLACQVCSYEQGKNVRAIPLKNFIKQVNENLRKQEQQVVNVDDLLENMDLVQQNILYSLKESVEEMARQIRGVEEKIISQYKKVKERIISQSYMGENLPKIINDFLSGSCSDLEYLNQKAKEMVDCCRISETNKIDLDFKPEQVMKNFQASEKEFVSRIKALTTQFSQDWVSLEKSISSSLISTPLQEIPKITFSPTLKSPSIQIDALKKIATQTVTQVQEGRFAAVDQPLDLNQKSFFAFNIVNHVNWIGLGVCLPKILKPKNFSFQHSALGHGCYLISSNGYSWSHSLTEQNSKPNSTSFLVGETVFCCFDPVESKLHYQLKKTKKIVTLNLTIDKNQEYHPCINCVNKDEKVSIAEISPEEYLEFSNEIKKKSTIF